MQREMDRLKQRVRELEDHKRRREESISSGMFLGTCLALIAVMVVIAFAP
jgi:predicted nucleic acid-binding Zn ribbon protein